MKVPYFYVLTPISGRSNYFVLYVSVLLPSLVLTSPLRRFTKSIFTTRSNVYDTILYWLRHSLDVSSDLVVIFSTGNSTYNFLTFLKTLILLFHLIWFITSLKCSHLYLKFYRSQSILISRSWTLLSSYVLCKTSVYFYYFSLFLFTFETKNKKRIKYTLVLSVGLSRPGVH